MTGTGSSPEGGEARGVVEAPRACPMCHSTHRISDPMRSEVHCADCGLVFEETELVASPPALAEGGVQDRGGRGIGPFVAPGGGSKRSLGSTLVVSRDGQGKRLDWHRRYEFQHLRRVMQRQTARTIDGPLDRSMARSEIAVATERMGLPSIVQAEAERIFREAKVRGLLRGRSLPASVGAAIYTACRRYSIPRTLGEVAEAAGSRRSDVGRTFKVIQRGGDVPVPYVGMKAFLTRYAEELALSAPVRSTVEEMLSEAQQNAEVSGLSPHGLVAALIYLAAEQHGERRSRAEVARVSAVTEVTLRSTSRILERILRPSDQG